MIAQLTGTLCDKQPGVVIVNVGGVGYEVTIPLSTFYVLGDVGGEVTLKVHTHVREDVIQLFGFRTVREKELFLKLTSVSGIGPRLAITVLSGMQADDLVRAIRTNDLARLVGIPGVGRKTAERLVIELRDKLSAMVLSTEEPQSAAGAAAATVRDDTIAALVALGYPKAVAERAVDGASHDEPDQSIEALLKRSLRRLSK